MMEVLSVIAACGALDRIRGSSAGVDMWAALINAGLLAYLVAGDWLTTTVILVTFVGGSSFGWGEPLGRALDGDPMRKEHLEWWQFGWLKRNPWAALTFRGAMWFPTMTIAMPLSTLAAKYLPGSTERRWQYAEAIRGALNATLVAGVMYAYQTLWAV
jgi:hypothetical protein